MDVARRRGQAAPGDRRGRPGAGRLGCRFGVAGRGRDHPRRHHGDRAAAPQGEDRGPQGGATSKCSARRQRGPDVNVVLAGKSSATGRRFRRSTAGRAVDRPNAGPARRQRRTARTRRSRTRPTEPHGAAARVVRGRAGPGRSPRAGRPTPAHPVEHLPERRPGHAAAGAAPGGRAAAEGRHPRRPPRHRGAEQPGPGRRPTRGHPRAAPGHGRTAPARGQPGRVEGSGCCRPGRRPGRPAPRAPVDRGLGSTVTLDEEGTEMASALRTSLDERVTALRDRWVERITSALDAGRVVDAVRASIRPPEPAARLSAELAVRLAEAAGQAMSVDTPPADWAALLEVVVDSPVRRTVKPPGPAGRCRRGRAGRGPQGLRLRARTGPAHGHPHPSTAGAPPAGARPLGLGPARPPDRHPPAARSPQGVDRYMVSIRALNPADSKKFFAWRSPGRAVPSTPAHPAPRTRRAPPRAAGARDPHPAPRARRSTHRGSPAAAPTAPARGRGRRQSRSRPRPAFRPARRPRPPRSRRLPGREVRWPSGADGSARTAAGRRAGRVARPTSSVASSRRRGVVIGRRRSDRVHRRSPRDVPAGPAQDRSSSSWSTRLRMVRRPRVEAS